MLDLINKNDKWTNYVKIFICTTIGLYAFNLFNLVAFTNLVFVLYLCDNKQRFKFILAYFFAGLIYLPLFINFTIQQYQLVRETHLPFYLTLSLFIIYTPLFGYERPPSSSS
jgi:hypothetical protein